MVETVKNGTSINHLELSDLERRTNPLKSSHPVNPTHSNTTAPAQDGGRCGDSRMDSLLTTKIREYSLFRITRIKKLNQWKQKIDLEEETHPNCGLFHIFIRLRVVNSERRVLIQQPVSESTNYSCSDLDFQCRELLNVSVQAILLLRNGPRTEKLKNGNLIQYQRPSEATTGLPMYSLWKEPTLDAEP
jgi:hypothetical protein